MAALGPVKLNFSGTARIVEADEAAHRMVLHAAGSEDKGKGTADMTITATMAPPGGGTRGERRPGPADLRRGGAVTAAG